jgi:hypothetical protein
MIPWGGQVPGAAKFLLRNRASFSTTTERDMDKVPMTKGGYETLLEEAKRLKTKERPAIV